MTEIVLPTPVPVMAGKPIIREELKPRNTAESVQFIPEKHLSFKNEPKTLSMEDIGLLSDKSISHVAISEPFPLFTEEAIQTMRGEIFTTEVWENCRYSSEFAGCQIRGYCEKLVAHSYVI
jgi:hypothetical protein